MVGDIIEHQIRSWKRALDCAVARSFQTGRGHMIWFDPANNYFLVAPVTETALVRREYPAACARGSFFAPVAKRPVPPELRPIRAAPPEADMCYDTSGDDGLDVWARGYRAWRKNEQEYARLTEKQEKDRAP